MAEFISFTLGQLADKLHLSRRTLFNKAKMGQLNWTLIKRGGRKKRYFLFIKETHSKK